MVGVDAVRWTVAGQEAVLLGGGCSAAGWRGGCDELTTLRGALPCCWVVRVAVYRRGKERGCDEV